MSVFNNRINEILEKTKLDANELTLGDFIVNTNPECDHAGSKGIVFGVKPMEDETGTVGNLVRYLVINKGDKFNPGDILDKTEIQLDKADSVDEEESKAVDKLQTVLDVVGLEPSVGSVADLANVGISLGRAGLDKSKRTDHLANAGISAVSLVPFGDVAKLAKIKPIRKSLVKGFKGIKNMAKAKKAEGTRFNENYADGKVKGKSRPGRVKRSGASCKGSVSSLRAKAKKAGGEKGKMYHWCANMKGGKKKK